MRVIALKRLKDHWRQPGRGDSEQPLKAWFALASAASWTNFAELREQFGSASAVGDRAVFNIAGNKYRLIDARSGTAEGDHLDVLVTLVQAYEAAHHAIGAPDPIALLEFVLEQRGLHRTALQPMPGGRVSEIMRRKRALTLPMIRRLQRELRLPADALVQPYPIGEAQAA